MGVKNGLCFGGPYHGKQVVSRTSRFCVATINGIVWFRRGLDGPDTPETEIREYEWSDDLEQFVCKAPDLPRIE